LLEVLDRIHEDPPFPALAADWLYRTFGDQKSYSSYKARCKAAWRDELPVGLLLEAYEQAVGPKARSRGVIFMFALRGADGGG